jgi:succinate dehydrogenase flavin-adding protein (antitoxin of CptAB toxin-antitoxin module)
MKELDRLLSAYLERDFPTASAAEQSGFRELLDLQDPVLYDYCLGRDRPAVPHLAALIDRIVRAPVPA